MCPNDADEMVNQLLPFVQSLRSMFYAYHQAMKHHYTDIILSLFGIPFVLKCAVKSLKICLQINR